MNKTLSPVLGTSAEAGTKPRKNSRLVQVIIISAILHVVGGLILGGIKVVEYIVPDEVAFEAPDEIIVEEPPREVKVTIKPQRVEMESQALKLTALNEIKVDAVDVDLPDMSDSFTVSAGIGSGGTLSLGSLGAATLSFPDISGFGTSEKLEYAWEGTVYLFEERKISSLRNSEGDWFTKYRGDRRGDRQTQKIYNYVLNVPSQDFTEGFPGVTDQYEWFAVDFELTLHWPTELAGLYEFRLTSDDGSILVIDRDIVIDNDGTHGMDSATGEYEMNVGRHAFRVAYFQGPATKLGLILEYRKAGEADWRVFDMKELIKYQM